MDIPVWAGPNRVDVHASWMRDYGQASLDVVVHPGEVVPVFYAVPWHQFSRGSIGHEKQARNGLGAMLAVVRGIARRLPRCSSCSPASDPGDAGPRTTPDVRHGIRRSDQPDARPVTPTRWCPAACS